VSLPDLSAARLPAEVVWIDVLDGEAAETAFVERSTGLRLPTFEELSEIESSSRLRSENGALYLSTPIVFQAQSAEPLATPVGFVLTRERLVTVRFKNLTSFDIFKERAAKSEVVHRSSAGAFAGLMDAIVDRAADALELVGSELDNASHRIFRAEITRLGVSRSPDREGSLRDILRRVGRGGDLASKIRDSLLGIGRVIPYVIGLSAPWLPAEVKPALDSLRQDVSSLNDYEIHLANKVQLLLDATMGLINIEQNNIIKVLTIVSVVGVPPTLVASIYGMNFRHMPELAWSWGYPYGLALVALSTLIPLGWFKMRGWF
jgi:magnesium transporter